MRVLITGIDGFVGSHTAEFLLRQGSIEVHGTIIPGSPNPNVAEIQSSLNLHTVDLVDSEQVFSVVRSIQPDRIIHLAGQAFVPTSVRDPIGTFQVNILGGVAILESARRMSEEGKKSAVLMISTGEVYGRVDENQMPITEDFPLRPNNPYAASKASIDLISQQYRSSFGLDVTVARPFNHVGPRQNPIFVCSDFAKQVAEISLGMRQPQLHVGNIDSERDFTDVRDVIRAYWSLLEKSHLDPVYNVCTGSPIKIRRILDQLISLSRKEIKVVIEKDRLRAYDVPVVIGSANRLREATGWMPTIKIEDTIRELYEYWKHQLSAS